MYRLFFFSVFESRLARSLHLRAQWRSRYMYRFVLWGFGEAKKCMALLLFYTHGDFFCRLFVITKAGRPKRKHRCDFQKSSRSTFSLRTSKGHRRGSSVSRHVFSRVSRPVYLRQHTLP